MKYYFGSLVFLCGIIAVSFAGGVVFQTIEPPLPQINGKFGIAVSGVGDVDGDICGDILIGAYQEHGGLPYSGRAYLYSGNDGGLLTRLSSPTPIMWGRFGRSVSGIGDIDEDGCSDLLIGADREYGGQVYSGKAYIYSGQTGELRHSLQSAHPGIEGWFGFSVSSAGDVDANGSPDVIVGAPWEFAPYIRSGRAYVFDGISGTFKYELESPNPVENGCFGVAVCSIGDVDGDAFDDFAVGAQNDREPSSDSSGRVYIYNGYEGSLIRTFKSPIPELGCAFGGSVAPIDDITGDGIPDIIVGAWAQDSGAEDAGRAYVLSSQTGTVIHILESPAPEHHGYFGLSVSSVGDVNYDGYPDIAVGACTEDAPISESGRVYLFCGNTGNLLYSLESPNPDTNARFGYSVSNGRDMNTNGIPDIIIGAPGDDIDSINSGRAYVFELPPVTFPMGHSLVDGSIELHWSALPGTVFHWIFGESNHAQFDPDLGSFSNRVSILPGDQTTWSSSYGIGNETEQWSYIVIAVDEANCEISRSEEIGEFDFFTTGNP